MQLVFIEPSWNSHVNESLSSALFGPVLSMTLVFSGFSSFLGYYLTSTAEANSTKQ